MSAKPRPEHRELTPVSDPEASGAVLLWQHVSWNVPMDAGNISANAQAAMAEQGATVNSISNGFTSATGPGNETLYFFLTITTDGPYSLYSLVVGSTDRGSGSNGT